MLFTAMIVFILGQPAPPAIEQVLLDRHQLVERIDPSTISIIIPTGDVAAFMDTDSAAWWSRYFLVDYLPEPDLWVLEVNGSRWLKWLLVKGSSGTIHSAVSPPVPSPDGSRLLCVNQALTNELVTGGVQIWRIEDFRLELEFEETDRSLNPLHGTWQSDSAIVIRGLIYDPADSRYVSVEGALSLDRIGNWSLDLDR